MATCSRCKGYMGQTQGVCPHCGFDFPQKPDLFRQARRRRRIVTALAILVIIGIGYLSNAYSKTACEERVASRLMNYVGSRPFYLLVEGDDQGAAKAFTSLKGKYTVAPYNPEPGSQKVWPYAHLEASGYLPFLISVEYAWERGPLVGGGAKKWYFCLFGILVEIGESNGWVT